MNVNLGPVFDKFVAGLIESGEYQTQSEVVREGLRMLKERESLRELRMSELRKKIASGAEEADRGLFTDGSAVIAKILKNGKARKRRSK